VFAEMPTILQTLAKCKKLAKAECCNFCSDDSSCIKNQRLCIFFCPFDGDDVLLRCLFFETSVLPIDSLLETHYKVQRKITGVRQLSKCICGKLFVPNSNSQKYCSEECKQKAQKQQNKIRKQNQRKKLICHAIGH
jgi:hypothetical protein